MTPALGYYLWPARWAGAPPANAEAIAEADKAPGGTLVDVIFETDLPGGVRSRVHRDGMLAYDFSGSSYPTAATGDEMALYAARVQLINAHLACLKSSVGPGPHIAPATGETVIGIIWNLTDPMYSAGGGFMAGIGALTQMIVALARARVEPAEPDWRFTRMTEVVTEAQIERSYVLLRELLELDDSRRSKALLYAELIVRAEGSLSVEDNAGALVYAWTAAEGILKSLYLEWVARCSYVRDPGPDTHGNPRAFLNSNRSRDLASSKVTAWHMAEIGSLVGWLPFDLYETVRRCAASRNRWLHNQDMQALNDARNAIEGAQKLFQLAEGIDLRPPHLHSTDG
jgi:hypothetical protein